MLREFSMNKKLMLILFAAVGLLVFSAESHAAPVGNPTAQTPSQKLSIGPLIDIYSQDFKANGYRITGKGNRLFLNFNYGVDRNVNFFGNAGFSKEDLEFGGNTYSGNYGMGIQFGARATLGELRPEHIKFGGGAKLLLARSSVDFSSTTKSNVDWTEFGLFGGMSFEAQPDMIPYLGLQIARTTTKIVDGTISSQSDFNEDGLIGLFGGLDLKIQKDISIGMELRVLNEISATVNCNFSF